jgi:uncharacterized protein (TIGR00251 family)
LQVKIKTLQQKDLFYVNENFLVIEVKDPPVKGKANKKLLRLFRKKFKTEVSLESGLTSTIKVVRLKDINKEQVLDFLDELKEG